MSLFSKLAPAGPTLEELADRYKNLMIHAENLELDPDQVFNLMKRADLVESDLTKDKLDTLHMLIESAVEQNDLRAEAKEIKPIDSAEMLDWYFQQQVIIQAQIDAITAQMQAALAGPKAELTSLNYLYAQQAKDYAERRYKETGKKTEHFPHGSIKVKTQANDEYVVEDEKALQEWLDKLEPLSRAKLEVYPKTYTRNLDAIKERAATGSVIPGIKKKPAGDYISLKAGGK
jgi:hypothetical protein